MAHQERALIQLDEIKETSQTMNQNVPEHDDTEGAATEPGRGVPADQVLYGPTARAVGEALRARMAADADVSDHVRALLARVGENYRAGRAERLAAENAGLRNLLAAVLAAVDVPLPGLGEADERRHGKRLTDRAHCVVVAVGGVVGEGHDPGRAAGWLAEQTAAAPVDYRAWDGGQDAGEETGR